VVNTLECDRAVAAAILTPPDPLRISHHCHWPLNPPLRPAPNSQLWIASPPRSTHPERSHPKVPIPTHLIFPNMRSRSSPIHYPPFSKHRSSPAPKSPTLPIAAYRPSAISHISPQFLKPLRPDPPQKDPRLSIFRCPSVTSQPATFSFH
jgi:hypothetical protein